MAGDALEVEGVIIECHRGDLHSVLVAFGEAKRTILARRSGRLVNKRINCLPGDRVKCELSSYDPSRGRITYRL